MRVVIQRVKHASVTIEGTVRSSIERGLLVFVGIEERDTSEDVDWLVRKTAALRIFDDGHGVMNLSVVDIGGEMLVVSQFTLHALTKKGNRPSYIRSAGEALAKSLYEAFVASLSAATGRPIGTGEFGANMQVELLNDGPVTIWIDSRQKE